MICVSFHESPERLETTKLATGVLKSGCCHSTCLKWFPVQLLQVRGSSQSLLQLCAAAGFQPMRFIQGAITAN